MGYLAAGCVMLVIAIVALVFILGMRAMAEARSGQREPDDR